MSKIHFPKNFFWGASVSAHQVEGGNKNQWSEWEIKNAVRLANESERNFSYIKNWENLKSEILNPDNYISGKAANHYKLYKQDIQILKKLNLNAFRFSIEWSRIEPIEGEFNQKEIEYYRKYISELRKNNIEPFVTLWHWTMPIWFTNLGAFEKRNNIKYFLRFVEKVAKEFPEIKFWIILNEPGIYSTLSYRLGQWPPQHSNFLSFIKVYLNLIRVHKETYKLFKLLNPKLAIGSSENIAYNFTERKDLISRFNVWFAKFQAFYFIKRIQKYSDFIGLNFYFTNRYEGWKINNRNENVSDMGWNQEPDKIYDVLLELKRFNKPIYITENGLADGKDVLRKWYLTESLSAIHKAINQGVDVRGYLHWSFLDNFEWDKGFWPRFGLVKVDFKTFKRKIKKSAEFYSKIVSSNSI